VEGTVVSGPFSVDPLPRKVRALYGLGLAEAVRAGRVEWRHTGTTHVELRERASGRRMTLTCGPSADNPAQLGKLRTLLRRAGGGGP
jgi:hypothetical protein